MDRVGEFSFFPLEFTKIGVVSDPAQLASIRQALADDAGVTDAFVVSHGWNNDMADALALYRQLFSNVSAAMSGAPERARTVVVGVLWPSKRFTRDELVPGGGVSASGGAATAGFDDEAADISPADLRAKLSGLKGVFDGLDVRLEEMAAVTPLLAGDVAARRRFVDVLRDLVPARSTSPREDASDRFLAMDGDDMLSVFNEGVVYPSPNVAGGVADFDDAVSVLGGDGPPEDAFSGARSAAWRLLNYATYYQMKERAGVVGAGLGAVLSNLRARRPDLKLHLVGHSFGARVVTAAVNAEPSFAPSSLSLLQGAFSHNGFSASNAELPEGHFRKVVAEWKVAGPIVVTHTVNDQAVGLMYPLASRLRHDRKSAFGDETDPYGGLGRNGAVRLTGEEVEAVPAPREGSPWLFPRAKVSNVRADAFINSHGDVANDTVARILVAAAGLDGGKNASAA